MVHALLLEIQGGGPNNMGAFLIGDADDSFASLNWVCSCCERTSIGAFLSEQREPLL
jgi:hypothetical protein